MANELRLTYNGSANIYAIVRRHADSKVWNGSGFVAWSDADIATYAVALSATGGDLYAANFPAITEAGYFGATYYLRASATPATDDNLLGGATVRWTGSAAIGDPPAIPDGLPLGRLVCLEPPASLPIAWTQALGQLNVRSTNTSQSWLEFLIAAATEYAEMRTRTDLVPRVWLATYWTGERLILPTGPLLEIQSVSGADATYTTAFTLQHIGKRAEVVLNPGTTLEYPIRVVYRAGYEPTSTIPKMFTLAILQHVATLFENRESISDKQKLPIPHALDDFYRHKSRATEIG